MGKLVFASGTEQWQPVVALGEALGREVDMFSDDEKAPLTVDSLTAGAAISGARGKTRYVISKVTGLVLEGARQPSRRWEVPKDSQTWTAARSKPGDSGSRGEYVEQARYLIAERFSVEFMEQVENSAQANRVRFSIDESNKAKVNANLPSLVTQAIGLDCRLLNFGDHIVLVKSVGTDTKALETKIMANLALTGDSRQYWLAPEQEEQETLQSGLSSPEEMQGDLIRAANKLVKKLTVCDQASATYVVIATSSKRAAKAFAQERDGAESKDSTVILPIKSFSAVPGLNYIFVKEDGADLEQATITDSREAVAAALSRHNPTKVTDSVPSGDERECLPKKATRSRPTSAESTPSQAKRSTVSTFSRRGAMQLLSKNQDDYSGITQVVVIFNPVNKELQRTIMALLSGENYSVKLDVTNPTLPQCVISAPRSCIQLDKVIALLRGLREYDHLISKIRINHDDKEKLEPEIDRITNNSAQIVQSRYFSLDKRIDPSELQRQDQERVYMIIKLAKQLRGLRLPGSSQYGLYSDLTANETLVVIRALTPGEITELQKIYEDTSTTPRWQEYLDDVKRDLSIRRQDIGVKVGVFTVKPKGDLGLDEISW